MRMSYRDAFRPCSRVSSGEKNNTPKFWLQFYIIACLSMCYSFRLMKPLSKVETRRDSLFALYITIINCIDE